MLTVHPTPKFAGRRVGIGVRSGALVRWEDIVLNVGDEEKYVGLETRSDRVLSVRV